MIEDPTVLLVEDEEAHVKALQRAFLSTGEKLRLHTASTIREARAFLEHSTPDLVITDLILPDGKGTDLLSDEEDFHDIPVLIMTAYGTQETAVEVIKAGALDYVVKSDSTFIDMPRMARRAIREWDHVVSRKKAENQLRESEELLRTTGRMARVGGWQIDAESMEVTWSEEVYRIHEAPIVYKPSLENAVNFFHEDDRPRLIKAIENALLHGTPYDMEIRFITAKGKRLWTRTICEPEVANGKTIRLRGTFQDVTKLKTTEEALRQTYHRLDLALEAGNLGLWDWNTNTDEVYYDERWGGMLGYAPEEIEPHLSAWKRLVHPDDKAKVLKRIDEHVQGLTQQFHCEQRLKTKSDDWKWILAIGRIIERNQDGAAARILGIHLDITERRTAEELTRKNLNALKQSEAIAQLGYFERNWQTGEGYWSDGFYKLLGKEPGSVSSHNEFIGYIHESDRERITGHIKKSLETGAPMDVEFRLVQESGNIVTIHGIAENAYNQEGRPLITKGTFQDISQRKKAKEALQESEERYRLLADQTLDVIWQMNLDLRFTYVNPAISLIFGHSQEEWIGTKLSDHCDEQNFSKMSRIVAEELSKGLESKGTVFEAVMLKKNKEPVKVEIHGKFLFDKDGRPAALQGTTRDITARKEAEEALNESRESFTNIVENSADGILVLGSEGEIVYINYSAITLLGYEEGYLKNTRFGYPVVSGDIATIQIVRPDGEIRDVEMRTAPINWFGRPAHVVMLHDMTERQRHEQELRKEKEKTEQYLSVAGVMFVILDKDGHVIKVNRKTCEVLGWESDELLGRDWFSTAIAEETRSDVRKLFQNLMAGTVDQFEYVEAPILTKTGETRLISWHNALLKDINGAVEGTVSSGEDITERKAMETRLADSEERYRVIFQRSSESVLIARPEGEIVTANPATAELLGVEEDELTCLNIADFYHNLDDRTAFRKAIETKGFVKDYPIVFRQRNGTEKYCLLSSSLWKDQQGEIIGYLSMLRDITEARKLEEQLRQAQKMESIGTLAGGIAHDFNNILTIIQGYSEMVLLDKTSDHPDYSDLYAVNAAAQRGAELVKQLLTFSRKVETNMRPVNLNQEIQTAVKLLSRTIPKMIDMKLVLSEDLSRIQADPGQLEQIVVNLAVNAKHAMPEGGILTFETANITLGKEYCRTQPEASPGEYVYLRIEDTGCGMRKEMLGRIFEPFFSTKKQGEGTGLGLAMVYGIVKNHGGHITCNSEPGMGTIFTIYLPAIKDETVEREITIEWKPPVGKETILLVDDEEMIRDLGSKILERAGYKVITAQNGEQAVATYRNRRDEIDLVMLDLIMPGMGGRQALDELKRLDPQVCVVIASGYAPEGIAKTSTETGADAFVSKPFNRNEVLRKVREALDR